MTSMWCLTSDYGTTQYCSILVKTNHFATHCAESAGHLYLSLLETHLCPVENEMVRH